MHRDVVNYAERLMEEMLGVLGDEIDISGGAKTSSLSGKNATAPGTDESTGTPGSVNIEEMLETQRKLTGSIESASVTLKKTLESMKEDNRSDYTYFAGLANMDVRIDELLGERRGIFENFASVDIPRAGRLMKREIAEFEEDILFLDSMIKGEKLRDSLLSAKELMKEYSELSEMMTKLGETGDEALKAEIEKKLAELSKLMSELARKMSAMSGDIQEGFLNRDAFKSIDMEKKLDEIIEAHEGREYREGDADAGGSRAEPPGHDGLARERHAVFRRVVLFTGHVEAERDHSQARRTREGGDGAQGQDRGLEGFPPQRERLRGRQPPQIHRHGEKEGRRDNKEPLAGEVEGHQERSE